jgi:HAD superfamily hydrolase (TIGR01662 family)
MTRAVLFEVDFTLIYPGPTFQGEGYQAFCRRHGVEVDPARFGRAVASAGALLDTPEDTPYDDDIYVKYTRHIIEQMGGQGEGTYAAARDIYAEWAACHHFELYPEVPDALRALYDAGLRIGLVSNSHRCLASFQTHFELQGLIAATVSSSEHGFMKPHPSIFRSALALMDVEPAEALMVGDSVRHDVEGALRVGMRAALVYRSDQPHPRQGELAEKGVPVLRSLGDLACVLSREHVNGTTGHC